MRDDSIFCIFTEAFYHILYSYWSYYILYFYWSSYILYFYWHFLLCFVFLLNLSIIFCIFTEAFYYIYKNQIAEYASEAYFFKLYFTFLVQFFKLITRNSPLNIFWIFSVARSAAV